MDNVQACIDGRMHRLAQQDGVEVLEYAYDAQSRGADAEMCVKLATMVAERRRALGRSQTVTACAKILREEDSDIDDFAKNFPAVFNLALDYEGAPRHLSILKQLARIRKRVDERDMSEAEGNVHATRVILEKTMRSPTKEEASRSEPTKKNDSLQLSSCGESGGQSGGLTSLASLDAV
jgi:hypothetical protein